MKEFKGTSGPWHRNIKSDGKYPGVFAGRNTHVAIAKQMGTPEETEANISLIAAAPELLDTLIICYNSLATYGKHPIIEAQVKKVIAKANGRNL